MKLIALTLLVLALAAVSVSAQGGVVTPAPSAAVEEAVVTVGSKPNGLRAARVFSPPPTPAEADAPIVGKPPANLKPSVVTEHIYGGAVEFEKTRGPNGCPCRRQVPEKYRYDTRFRRPEPTPAPCPCALANANNATKPEDELPPIVARIRREAPVVNLTATACANPNLAAPAPVEKVAPKYYKMTKAEIQAHNLAATTPAPCNATAVAAANAAANEKIAPKFYPTRGERWARKKARHARKAAVKAQKKAEKKAAKKVARAVKKAVKKAAKKAARKAAKEAAKKKF